jgi:GH18 family chitinase
MNRLLIVFACLWVLASSCSKSSSTGSGSGGTTPTSSTISPPPAFGFYVVGYFPSYRDPSTIPDTKFKMCNVINYAFGTLNTSGGISLANPTVLTAMRTKAKANGAKVFISLNGSITDWKNMASTPAGRTAYIKQAMDIVRNYGLDGVDVDWEFPSTSDGTDATYLALMKELSDSCHLGAKYYLSTALTSGKYVGSYTNAINSSFWAGNYVDFFNIMAYDDFSNTVPYKHHSDYTLATVCLNYWIGTRGIPSSKVVLGVPAYGRPSGIAQTGTTLTYNGILGQGGSALSDSAVVTASGISNYTIYYNGQPTIKRKAMLAKNTAGGVMMWEYGQDTHDATSLLKAVCDTIGRPY